MTEDATPTACSGGRWLLAFALTFVFLILTINLALSAARDVRHTRACDQLAAPALAALLRERLALVGFHCNRGVSARLLFLAPPSLPESAAERQAEQALRAWVSFATTNGLALDDRHWLRVGAVTPTGLSPTNKPLYRLQAAATYAGPSDSIITKPGDILQRVDASVSAANLPNLLSDSAAKHPTRW